MQAGDNPRFVVDLARGATPQMLYEDLSGARGNGAKAIKAVKHDLHRDRTSATSFLANALRLPWLVLPLSCIMLCAHIPSNIPHGPRRNLRPSSYPLQNRHPDQTVQGPDSPPPAQFLSCQSACTSGDDPALRRL